MKYHSTIPSNLLVDRLLNSTYNPSKLTPRPQPRTHFLLNQAKNKQTTDRFPNQIRHCPAKPSNTRWTRRNLGKKRLIHGSSLWSQQVPWPDRFAISPMSCNESLSHRPNCRSPTRYLLERAWNNERDERLSRISERGPRESIGTPRRHVSVATMQTETNTWRHVAGTCRPGYITFRMHTHLTND